METLLPTSRALGGVSANPSYASIKLPLINVTFFLHAHVPFEGKESHRRILEDIPNVLMIL